MHPTRLPTFRAASRSQDRLIHCARTAPGPTLTTSTAPPEGDVAQLRLLGCQAIYSVLVVEQREVWVNQPDNHRADLEHLIDKAYHETFRGTIDPLEIAEALHHEANRCKSVVGGDRVLVPNQYTVELSLSDYGALNSAMDAGLFAQSLAQAQAALIGQHNWIVYGDIIVVIDQHDDLEKGNFRIATEVIAGLPDSIQADSTKTAVDLPPISAAAGSALRLNILVGARTGRWGRADRTEQRLDQIERRLDQIEQNRSGTEPLSPSAGPDPIDWFTLTGADRERTLEALGEFVETLVRRYALQQEILPCWWQHGDAIEEMTSLWQAREVAYAPGSDASMASWWQDLLERSRMRLREMFVICRNGHVTAHLDEWMSDEQRVAFSEYRRQPPAP